MSETGSPHLPLGALMLGVLALAPIAARAQSDLDRIPDEFTNLQILPEDISKQELIATMRGWGRDLGVGCRHCHVGSDDEMDFASDEREAKRESRGMLVLTRKINGDLEAAESEQVTCYTCHHALPHPPRSIGEELASASRQRGVAGAIDRFRDLHGSYYGTGRYDLSAHGLAGVAQDLAEAGQAEDALQLLALGLELFPDSADVHAAYGHVYAVAGQPEQAKQSFEKALELDRRNRSARRGLRELERAAQQ